MLLSQYKGIWPLNFMDSDSGHFITLQYINLIEGPFKKHIQ